MSLISKQLFIRSMQDKLSALATTTPEPSTINKYKDLESSTVPAVKLQRSTRKRSKQERRNDAIQAKRRLQKLGGSSDGWI